MLSRAGLEALHVGSLILRIPGSTTSALYPSHCSRGAKRDLAQFGNLCTAHAKGQRTFPRGISCSKEILLAFFKVDPTWEREKSVAQAAPTVVI